VPAGLLDDERPEALVGAGRHHDPVGAVAVEHHGLQPGEQPTAGPAGGSGADALHGVAGTLLLEGDRAAAAREQIAGTEVAGDQRRQHGGGEERTGEREPAHLLQDDHHVDQPGAAVGVQQFGDAEVDQPVPDIVGDTAVVVEHRTHVGRGRPVLEEAAHRRPELLLLRAEREVHVCLSSSGRGYLTRR